MPVGHAVECRERPPGLADQGPAEAQGVVGEVPPGAVARVRQSLVEVEEFVVVSVLVSLAGALPPKREADVCVMGRDVIGVGQRIFVQYADGLSLEPGLEQSARVFGWI